MRHKQTALSLACALSVIISGCAARQAAAPPPAVRVETVEVVKEVQRPCAGTIPARPAPLGVLPEDARALASMLGAKLVEYAGPGKYADRADALMARCAKP